MLKRFAVVVLVFIFASSVLAADLKSDLEQMVAKHQGKVALFAKNLKTGETIAIDADEPVQTASVIKLPVMIEAFYQSKAGKLDLSKKLNLTKAEQVPGSTQELAEKCNRCHDQTDNPAIVAPKMRGQDKDYLVMALRAYRDDKRESTTMHKMSFPYSNALIESLASWYASQPAN